MAVYNGIYAAVAAADGLPAGTIKSGDDMPEDVKATLPK
jgi:hypothetical protein